MGYRLSKIYTRTGDRGETGLSDGSRVSKDHLRIEAIGDIDELNSALGVVVSRRIPKDIRHCLTEIQHTLFDIGAELSRPPGNLALTGEAVEVLEKQLEFYNATLPPLREFILPGGTQASALCQLARAICRRAERHVVGLSRQETLNDQILAYLNRLADLLFVIARVLTRSDKGSEHLWRSRRIKSNK